MRLSSLRPNITLRSGFITRRSTSKLNSTARSAMPCYNPPVTNSMSSNPVCILCFFQFNIYNTGGTHSTGLLRSVTLMLEEMKLLWKSSDSNNLKVKTNEREFWPIHDSKMWCLWREVTNVKWDCHGRTPQIAYWIWEFRCSSQVAELHPLNTTLFSFLVISSWCVSPQILNIEAEIHIYIKCWLQWVPKCKHLMYICLF